MARRPKLVIGGSPPRGPIAGGLPNPALGGQVPAADRKKAGLTTPRNDHRSKKHYAGTVAGLGRPAARPALPTGHAGTTFKQVQGKKPSLMTRIGRFLGFGRRRGA